jgi:hypothetical protein
MVKSKLDTEHIASRHLEARELWRAGEVERARAAFEECVSYDRLGPNADSREVEDAKPVLACWMTYATFLAETGDLEEASAGAWRWMQSMRRPTLSSARS